MFAFSFIYTSFILATFIPVYAALYIVNALRRTQLRYLVATGIGITFWFFYDTMGDANSLAENNGLYPPSLFGGAYHFVLIGSFVAGILALAAFDWKAVPGEGSAPGRRALFLIPAGVALVMGIHGLGEGWDALSAVAAAPSASSDLQALIPAFGTLPALLSYPLHKILEACIFGVLYVAYVPRTETSKGRWWEIPLLGLLFAGPTAVGGAFGYFISFDTTYFFAFGVTSALYAALRLAESAGNSRQEGGRVPAHYGPKVVLALGLGMLLLYFAALLH